jgi:hypothetical protein
MDKQTEESLSSLKDKYKIALEALEEIARHGGKTIGGIAGTGKHCAERASAAIVLITTINNKAKIETPH